MKEQTAAYLQHMRPARSLEPAFPIEEGNVVVHRRAWRRLVIHRTDLCLLYPDKANSSLLGLLASPSAEALQAERLLHGMNAPSFAPSPLARSSLPFISRILSTYSFRVFGGGNTVVVAKSSLG